MTTVAMNTATETGTKTITANPRGRIRIRGATVKAALFWTVLIPAGAAAQVRWQITGATADLTGTAVADDFATPAVETEDCAVSGLTAIVLDHEFGIRCARVANDKDSAAVPPTFAQAEIRGLVFIDGDNSPEIRIEWLNLAACDRFGDGYVADAQMDLGFAIDLTIIGGPAGQPVIVYYSWNAFGGATTSHECPSANPPPGCLLIFDEDPVSSLNQLRFNGTEVASNRFDFAHPGPPGILGWNRRRDQRGTIYARVGDTVTIGIDSSVSARIETPPPRGVSRVGYEADGLFMGDLRITVGFPPPPPPPPEPVPFSEFSVDIGSDTELSDPAADGDEVFDPGDCYVWGGPALPLCGVSGRRDDVDIFLGLDFAPTPPDCLLASAAPTCGGVLSPGSWFDLDGHDSLDFSLIGLLGPFPGPVPFMPSDCVHSTQNIALSFDDDGPEHYAGLAASCEIPVNSPSPLLFTRFGETLNQDEVMGLISVSSSIPPLVTPIFMYPMANEVTIHASMSPNPDTLEADDDDVDALDLMLDGTVCTTWFFSPDHEATGFDVLNGADLDAGGIYEVIPGASPEMVVDEVFHLGLLEETDIDAFEFVWLADMPNGITVEVFLGLIFSVDDDDPLTPDDESGGLDPTMIYASFMDGGYFEFLTTSMGEDIDALATWRTDLLPSLTTGACCFAGSCALTTQLACGLISGSLFHGPGTDCVDINQNGEADICECPTCRGDMNGDGQLDGADMQEFTACLVGAGQDCGCADMDADADLDTDDIGIFVASLLSGQLFVCP